MHAWRAACTHVETFYVYLSAGKYSGYLVEYTSEVLAVDNHGVEGEPFRTFCTSTFAAGVAVSAFDCSDILVCLHFVLLQFFVQHLFDVQHHLVHIGSRRSHGQDVVLFLDGTLQQEGSVCLQHLSDGLFEVCTLYDRS